MLGLSKTPTGVFSSSSIWCPVMKSALSLTVQARILAAPVLQKAKPGLGMMGLEQWKGNRHFLSYLGGSDLLLLLLNMNELVLHTSVTDHMVFLVKVADVPLLLCFALLHKFSLFSFYPVCNVIVFSSSVSGYSPEFLNVHLQIRRGLHKMLLWLWI